MAPESVRRSLSAPTELCGDGLETRGKYSLPLSSSLPSHFRVFAKHLRLLHGWFKLFFHSGHLMRPKRPSGPAIQQARDGNITGRDNLSVESNRTKPVGHWLDDLITTLIRFYLITKLINWLDLLVTENCRQLRFCLWESDFTVCLLLSVESSFLFVVFFSESAKDKKFRMHHFRII